MQMYGILQPQQIKLLNSFFFKYTLKFNIHSKNDGPWKMYLLLNIGHFGVSNNVSI